MAKARRKQENGEVGLAVATGTAVASVLTNLAQAVNRAELASVARQLEAQRDHLVALLSDRDRAHGVLRMELESALRELTLVRRERQRLERGVERLLHENTELKGQLARNAKRRAFGG